MATIHDPIKAEIAAGHTSAALAMIDERMAHDDEADRAGLLYLKGRAYMKAGVWHKAMNAFLSLIHISEPTRRRGISYGGVCL